MKRTLEWLRGYTASYLRSPPIRRALLVVLLFVAILSIHRHFFGRPPTLVTTQLEKACSMSFRLQQRTEICYFVVDIGFSDEYPTKRALTNSMSMSGSALDEHETLVALMPGTTYDVLILDACGADENAIICPVEAFLAPNLVSKMMSALKPTGVLVVNVLSVSNPEGAVQKVKRKLTESFNACLTFYLPMDYNSVVACVPYGHGLFNNDWRDRMLVARFEQVKKVLGLYDVLKDVQLV